MGGRVRDPLKEGADGVLALDWVPERNVETNSVAVSPALAESHKDPTTLKLGNDSLHGALGDANLDRYVPEDRFGIPEKADQDVGVVG